MNKQEHINYWLESSENDWLSALEIAEKVKLPLDDEIISELKIVNEFNIQTRYPEYKNDFYKRCTKEFVGLEIKRIERLRVWIKSILANTQ